MRVGLQYNQGYQYMHQCRNEKTKNAKYVLNLGGFHLIVVIISTTISTDIDVFPPVLVIGIAGERERAEDGEGGGGNGGGGCPAGDDEEDGFQGAGDNEGVRGLPPRWERGLVVVPSASGGERAGGGQGRRAQAG